MPNRPRPENRHRMVRVEDDLWEAARIAAAKEDTTRAEVMREALRELVARNAHGCPSRCGHNEPCPNSWHDLPTTQSSDPHRLAALRESPGCVGGWDASCRVDGLGPSCGVGGCESDGNMGGG